MIPTMWLPLMDHIESSHKFHCQTKLHRTITMHGQGDSHVTVIEEETEIFGWIDPNFEGRFKYEQRILGSQLSCWFVDS